MMSEKNRPKETTQELTVQQARLLEKAYQRLETTSKKDKEPFIFVSYKSGDYHKVLIEQVCPLHETFGLRVYCDKDFASRNDHWVKQMEENLTSPYCQVMLCFLSQDYLCSYATLLELLQTQVGRDYNQTIPIIPIFLEEIPLKNDEVFHHLDLELEKENRNTGLPLQGIERECFLKYGEKMWRKLKNHGGYGNRCEDTLDYCEEFLEDVKQGKERILNTRFSYRFAKEIINYVCNDTHCLKYLDYIEEIGESLPKTLRDKIKNTAKQDVFHPELSKAELEASLEQSLSHSGSVEYILLPKTKEALMSALQNLEGVSPIPEAERISYIKGESQEEMGRTQTTDVSLNTKGRKRMTLEKSSSISVKEALLHLRQNTRAQDILGLGHLGGSLASVTSEREGVWGHCNSRGSSVVPCVSSTLMEGVLGHCNSYASSVVPCVSSSLMEGVLGHCNSRGSSVVPSVSSSLMEGVLGQDFLSPL